MPFLVRGLVLLATVMVTADSVAPVADAAVEALEALALRTVRADNATEAARQAAFAEEHGRALHSDRVAELERSFNSTLRELTGCSEELAAGELQAAGEAQSRRATQLSLVLATDAAALHDLQLRRAEVARHWVQERRMASASTLRAAATAAQAAVLAARRSGDSSACAADGDFQLLDDRINRAQERGEVAVEAFYGAVRRQVEVRAEAISHESYRSQAERGRTIEELVQGAEMGAVLSRMEEKLKRLEGSKEAAHVKLAAKSAVLAAKGDDATQLLLVAAALAAAAGLLLRELRARREVGPLVSREPLLAS